MQLVEILQSSDPAIRLAAHQIGMYLAMREIDTKDGIARWRQHNKAAAELRETLGVGYQVYAYPNKKVIKALYQSLQEGLISRAEFSCCFSSMRGEFRR